jgi:hypothetical protein
MNKAISRQGSSACNEKSLPRDAYGIVVGVESSPLMAESFTP